MHLPRVYASSLNRARGQCDKSLDPLGFCKVNKRFCGRERIQRRRCNKVGFFNIWSDDERVLKRGFVSPVELTGLGIWDWRATSSRGKDTRNIGIGELLSKADGRFTCSACEKDAHGDVE